MSEQVRAIRDVKRDSLSRTLEIVNSHEFIAISLPELKVMFECNQKAFDNLCELQGNIIAAARTAAARAAAIEWLPNVEADYITIRQKLCERIAQLGQANNHRDAQRIQAEPNRAAPMILGTPEGLGQFDGTHANWPPFRDLFIALVDSRPYASLNKLLYLKKACTGAAALTLAGYDPLEDCYQEAWNNLKSIYNDDYAVTQALVDRIIDLPMAISSEVHELRRIIDTITSTLRQLTALKNDVSQWDPIVINHITRKLPSNIVESWEQQRKRTDIPKLNEFLEFLDSRARARVFATGSTSATTAAANKREAKGFNQRHDNHMAKGQNLNYKAKGGERPLFQSLGKRKGCRHCTGDHSLGYCPILKDKKWPERKRIIVGLGVCWNCLNFGHYSFRCERPGCSNSACKGDKHHQLICPMQPLSQSDHQNDKIKRDK